MVHRPLRRLSPPESAGRAFDAWLEEIEDRLADPECDRNLRRRDVLFDIYYGAEPSYEERLANPQTRLATRATLLAFDPRNITMEPEHYAEIDPDQYSRVKPLQQDVTPWHPYLGVPAKTTMVKPNAPAEFRGETLRA